MSAKIVMDVGYVTGTKHLMRMKVSGHLMDRLDVPVVYPEDVAGMCGKCKGVNGGCSIYAPYFEHIKPSQSHIFIVDVAFDMAWAIKFAYSNPAYGEIRNNYFCCGYGDIITDRYLRKLVNYLTDNTGLYGLGVGHCAGCRSKKMCTVLRGEPCINMAGRRYSIEATGVECSTLNERLYGQRLGWWYKNAALPILMRRYGGVMTTPDNQEELESLLFQATRSIKSYMPVEDTPEPPEYTMEMLDVPEEACGEAGQYPAYVDIERAV